MRATQGGSRRLVALHHETSLSIALGLSARRRELEAFLAASAAAVAAAAAGPAGVLHANASCRGDAKGSGDEVSPNNDGTGGHVGGSTNDALAAQGGGVVAQLLQPAGGSAGEQVDRAHLGRGAGAQGTELASYQEEYTRREQARDHVKVLIQRANPGSYEHVVHVPKKVHRERVLAESQARKAAAAAAAASRRSGGKDRSEQQSSM